jgi:hypothetical protein
VIVDVSNFYHMLCLLAIFFGKRQDIILASNEDLLSSPGNNDRMTQMWSIDHMQYIFRTDFFYLFFASSYLTLHQLKKEVVRKKSKPIG